MQNIYETFEFNKIKEEIYKYAKTERGREYISSLERYKSFDELHNALEDLKEMISLIQRYGELPLAPSFNALRLIKEAKMTSILTARDLDMIANDVLTSISLVKFIKKIDVAYPRIAEKSAKFFDLTNLEKEIHRCINSAQAIRDEASSDLAAIRRKIRKCEQELQDKLINLSSIYSQYLSDTNMTIRDGHMVLPVKTSLKSKVMGIVYDVSDSGNTTFIEPIEIVQINNEVRSLKFQEQEEIRRILKALTSLVLIQEQEIILNNAIIAELDFLSSKSLYGLEINGEIAELSKDNVLELVNARHPLIAKDKVVANSYFLNKEKRIVIISGPNAGGKSVSLKTVGLLTLMFECGLVLPVSKAKLSMFNNIFVDIGDNQSISDNLSTFSAHMSSIAEILRLVNKNDLVLVDELGTGTDPKEGEALALSIIKYLEKKNVLGFISSHFDALKEYAFLSPNLDNGSMIFDEKELLPTYIYKQGIPGKSYALTVANRYGINEEIVIEANRYLSDSKQNSGDELISILVNKINETTKLEKELESRKKEIERKEKQVSTDAENLKEKRNKLLEDVEKQKADLIQKARKEIDEIISQLSTSDLKLHEVIELRKKLEDLEENNDESAIFDEEIKEGDFVSIPHLDMQGTVKRIKGNKAQVVSDFGFSFETDISKLHKEEAPKTKKVLKTKTRAESEMIHTNVPLELNIIGLYGDEALAEISRYIDLCRLKHIKQARIIHGFGSGKLRKVTHDYLSKQKDLTFRLGDEYEGGGGATVVIFK